MIVSGEGPCSNSSIEGDWYSNLVKLAGVGINLLLKRASTPVSSFTWWVEVLIDPFAPILNQPRRDLAIMIRALL